MTIVHTFPVINIILGSFLLFFILFSKNNLGKNNTAKRSLATIVFIYAIMSFEAYFSITKNEGYLPIMFLGYISFHFIGFFLCYFVSTIVNAFSNIKIYAIILSIYTFIRILLFLFFKNKVELMGGMEYFMKARGSRVVQIAEIDHIIACAFNLFFMIKALNIFKNTPLILVLDKQKEMYYRWGFLVIIINIVIISLMLINIIIAFYNFDFLSILIKIEPILHTIFFIVLTYSIMYFPVFAFTGKYEDLGSVLKEKYKNSSLVDSSQLFKEIDELVQGQKLFLDAELKLNTLSENLNKSIPYISQAINENTQKSFPDYINTFRIEEAKKKLLQEKPDTIFAIAIDVGFNSKAAFYTAFKKSTKTTPTSFRKQHL